jgi:hypothetical protein
MMTTTLNRSGQQLHSCDILPVCEINPAKVARLVVPARSSKRRHPEPCAPTADHHIGHEGRMMVVAAPSPKTAPHLLGDLLIGQTHVQIRAFDAFTATPTLSIQTSRAGNEAACGHHSGGAVSSRIPTRG